MLPALPRSVGMVALAAKHRGSFLPAGKPLAAIVSIFQLSPELIDTCSRDRHAPPGGVAINHLFVYLPRQRKVC